MFTSKATYINHQPTRHIALDSLLLSTALFKVDIHVHFDSLDVPEDPGLCSLPTAGSWRPVFETCTAFFPTFAAT